MRPLFTIHAGEYLVGEHILTNYPHLSVWVPTRDVGVDLLVTHPKTRNQVSLQVKFSRDFKGTHVAPSLQQGLRACGWWSFQRSKIASSPADYWVIVLYGFARSSIDYIVVKPSVLAERLRAVHGNHERYQVYFWTTASGRCWETRSLKNAAKKAIAAGTFEDRDRDFTELLAQWDCLSALGPP